MRLSLVSVNAALLLLSSQVAVADDYTLSRCLCSSENRWGYAFEYSLATSSDGSTGIDSHIVSRTWQYENKHHWNASGSIYPLYTVPEKDSTAAMLDDLPFTHNKLFNWIRKMFQKRKAHHTLPTLKESCTDSTEDWIVCGDNDFLSLESDIRKLPKKTTTNSLSNSDCNDICADAFLSFRENTTVSLCDFAETGKPAPWGNHDSGCKEMRHEFPLFNELEPAKLYNARHEKKIIIYGSIIGASILLGLIAAAAYGVFSCCRRLRHGRSEEFTGDKSDSEVEVVV